MTQAYRVFVVPHTHWDREWYQPFERFRMRLAKLVDGLIDLMAADPGFARFTLDGHTIPVEDYAEVRPKRLGALLELIRSGRVAVGPWYVLPDEFLISGEAAVRNLLLGHRLSTRYGRPMKVGYIPDTFGHTAQMPQVLRGFGIDTAILWRGVGNELQKTEFLWTALDGSEVLTEYLPNGYANAALLPADRESLAARVDVVDSHLEPMATTRNLLYMNGWDHLSPQPDLSTVVQTMRELTGREVQIATIETFLEAVKADLGVRRASLPRHHGELRSPERAQLLSGVLSARMYLKQANASTQTLLERWAEPWAAAAKLLAYASYPRGELWQAWRYLLQNHPHDSICGCSVDEVHDEMMIRFRKSQTIGEQVVAESLGAIAAAVDATCLPGPADAPVVVVFNPLGQLRTDVVTGTAVLQKTLIRRPVPRTSPEARTLYSAPTRFAEPPLPSVDALCLVDADGRRYPAQVLSIERGVELETHPQHLPINWLVDRVRFAFTAESVPAFGYRAYRVEVGQAASLTPSPSPAERASPALSQTAARIENEFLHVEAGPDGTLTVFDRRTGATYPGCHRLVDSGDRGDEYTYCPPEDDLEVGLSRLQVIRAEAGPSRASLEIQGILELPESLTPGRSRRSDRTISCPVRVTVTLHAGVPRVDFRTEVENLARDHRLRVAFPTGLAADHCWAETQFGVIRRSLALPTDTAGWAEQPLLTAPQQGFVDVAADGRGLALLNRGLPEYEVRPRPAGADIYLTLLRCVGWLSRGDMSTRVGHAGPGLPTPGAQCPGRHVFEYALYPHAGDWREGGVVAESQGFGAGLRAVDVEAPTGKLPAALSLVSLEPEQLVLSALKVSEEGDRLIVRACNASAGPVRGVLRCFRRPESAALVNLNEEEQAPLAMRPDGAVPLAFGPWQIVTVAVSF